MSEIEKRLEQVEKELAQIKRLYDASVGYGEKDPTVALVKARIAAEAICSQLCVHAEIAILTPDGKPPALGGMIGRLYKADVLPRTIATALHTVRELGNLGSHHHDDEESWDASKFVPPALGCLSTVVTWYVHSFHQIDASVESPVETEEDEESPETVYLRVLEGAKANGTIQAHEWEILRALRSSLELDPIQAISRCSCHWTPTEMS